MFIYHLWVKEPPRGVFPVGQGPGDFVKGLKIDPCGLYIGVGVGRGEGYNGGYRGGSDEKGVSEEEEDGGRKVDAFICDVEIFEAATGYNALAEPGMKGGLKGIVSSSGFEWSSEGGKLVFLGCRGNLDIRQ